MRLLLTLMLALTVSMMPWASYAVAVTELPGYSAFGLTEGFEAYLKEHPAVAEALAKNPEASRRLFASTDLQNKLMQGDVTISTIIADDDYDFSEEAITAALNHARNNTPTPETTARVEQATRSASNSGRQASIVTELDRLATTTPAGSNDVTPANPVTPAGPSSETEATTQAPIDINTRPSMALLAPDANGWPKYLHAPANCSSKESGKNYIHEPVYYDTRNNPRGGGIPNVGKPNTIWNYFYRGGNPFEMLMNAKDVIATPFVYELPIQQQLSQTDPELSFGYFANAHEAMTRRAMIWSISDCPNDFGSNHDLDPSDGNMTAGSNRLGAHCVAVAHGEWSLPFGSGTLPHPGYCKLEPGKRYFINVKSFDLTGEFEPECISGKCYVGGVGIIYSPNRVPYAGPCLDAAPYPLGYTSQQCGQNPGKTACEAAMSEETVCHDPTGKQGPVRLVQSCEAGTKPTWITGYNRPIYQGMVCESPTAVEHNPNNAVCAAHRDGQTRRAAAYNQQGNPIYEKVERCTLDNGRYRWKLVSGGGPAHLAQGITVETTLE